MTATQSCSSCATNTVKFIDKYDGRGSLPCRLEHLADPPRTDANEDFDEFRPGG